MKNETLNFQSFMTLNSVKKNIKTILSLYFFSLGSTILGFSLYLFISTFDSSNTALIDWSGQGLFWAFIIFFAAIFLLFLPVEFFNSYNIVNRTFNELIINIIVTIITSLFFLILFQILIPDQLVISSQIISITRSVSFAGFIVIPIIYFALHNVAPKVNLINKNSFYIILLVWTLSSQFFL
tara:strand:+ start:162 stop:707 length:546 start_codon:yes stop_codon:yes gene_type:complete